MIVKTQKDEIQNFLSDASNYKGFCDAVYFPRNTAEVSQILKEAGIKASLMLVENGNLRKF